MKHLTITESEFNDLAIQTFHHQYQTVEIYHQYVDLLKINSEAITSYLDIPFLPIKYFKSHAVIQENLSPQTIFTSSATGNSGISKHYVAAVEMYRKTALTIFQEFFGNPQAIPIMALLPSYLEREGSSLIEMVQYFISLNLRKEGGFYLYNHEELYLKLCEYKAKKEPVILFGVSFGLLDFCERYTMDFPELIIIETGGMKGKRTELTRNQLHKILKQQFNVPHVYSEYGMTELLSQAYYTSSGFFQTPCWMKVLIRDIHAPLTILPPGYNGGINIIDLANSHSCAFIATDDIGTTINNDRSFDVLGRMDHHELRGCNLMVE